MVDRIQTQLVDLLRPERRIRRLPRDHAVKAHLRKIAHAAQ